MGIRHPPRRQQTGPRTGSAETAKRPQRRSATADDPVAALERAFRATAFRIRAPLQLVLRVDAKCPALDRHLSPRRGTTAAVISAANPLGARQPEAENAARDRALVAAVRTMGLECWAGSAMPDRGGRAAEPAQLIAPVSLEVATTIARNFEQIAFLFHERGGRTRLVFTGLKPAGR